MKRICMQFTEARGECTDWAMLFRTVHGILQLRRNLRFAKIPASLWMTVFVLACACFWFDGAGLIAAQSSRVTREHSPLEQTLIANENSLIEAKKNDDGEFFKRTVSADFSLVGVDGMLLQGQEAIDNLGDSDLADLVPYDMKVVLGENIAIVTYDAIVREKPQEDQGPPPRYQHFSSVWVKRGDSWKLNFQQATPTHWGDW